MLQLSPFHRIGSTALHKCCSEGNLNVATLFLDKFKADIHAKNKVGRQLAPATSISFRISSAAGWTGNTPLHCAVYSAHLPIVKKLLECGAGQYLPRASTGNRTSDQLILMPGKDVLTNNLVGMTSLDYAFNPDIRHLLESYIAKEKKTEQ